MDDSAEPRCITDTGKYLCFLVTMAYDRQHVNPGSLVLAMTRLRDSLFERGVTSLSLPVYDPNRGYKILSEHMLGIAFGDKWFLLG